MLEAVTENEVQEILQQKPVLSKEVTEKIPLLMVEELPSGFKGYPQGTKISFEPITLGEMESLNTGSADVMRGLAMLLKAIHCNTLPSSSLYYWDVIYIGVQRKLLALGDTRGTLYEVCPECGNVVELTFDYTELAFRDMKAPALPIITTIGDTELEFAPLTMQDFLELDAGEGELGIYAKMVKNKPFNEALDILKYCYGETLRKIHFIDHQLDYGIEPLYTTCNNEIENPEYDSKKKNSKKMKSCGAKVRMEVRSPFEITFPSDTIEGYSDFEIQYGRE